jgi:predicted transcriptional regulator
MLTNSPTLSITGVRSDSSASLSVNGVQVATDSMGNFAASLSLVEGTNIVRLVASDGALHTQLTFAISLDTVAPSLVVFAPAEGQQLADDRPTVFGQSEVGARVWVNGVAADAQVFDGTFELRSVALALSGGACLQPATLSVLAQDPAGNVRSLTRTVYANQCVSHPVLSSPLPTVRADAGVTASTPLDLAAYFGDDAGPENLVFSTYVQGSAASAFSVAYSLGSLWFVWSDPAFTGPADVEVVAMDRAGESSDAATLHIEVSRAWEPNNAPPELTLPDAASVDALPAGGAISFIVSISDPDGDPVQLSVGVTPPGLRLRSIVPVSRASSSFLVTIEAALGLADPSPVWIEFVATDAHLATTRSALGVRVYDATSPPTLAVVAPSVPVISASDLASEGGLSGAWVEMSASRTVPHLYLDPATSLVRREATAANAERTYWRFFVTLPEAGGTQRVSVWAADPGLSEQEFPIELTVTAAPARPRLDQLEVAPLQLDASVGAWLTVSWQGDVASGDSPGFAWTVDGQFVSREPVLRNFPLEPGEHTVALTVRTSGGSASASTPISVQSTPTQLPTPGGPGLWFWIALGAVLAVGFVLGGTEIGFYFLVAGLLGALIDREHREKLLSHFVRGRIYQIIEYEPGIHLSELQRKAGAARGACAYHLHALEKAGLVRSAREGMYLRFFVTKIKVDPETYALAEGDREILREIEARPGITDLEIGQRLARSTGSVARAVQKLAQSGYIEARREGNTLQCFPRTTPVGGAATNTPP